MKIRNQVILSSDMTLRGFCCETEQFPYKLANISNKSAWVEYEAMMTWQVEERLLKVERVVKMMTEQAQGKVEVLHVYNEIWSTVQ